MVKEILDLILGHQDWINSHQKIFLKANLYIERLDIFGEAKRIFPFCVGKKEKHFYGRLLY